MHKLPESFFYHAMFVVFTCVPPVSAQTFDAPQGGWAYTFQGDSAFPDEVPFFALDGTWDHSSSSDRWDGSEIGDGSPGGVSALEEFDIDFIRVQDPGDPRDYGMDDPSNRRLYFTHRLADDFAFGDEPENLDSIVSDGITLHFRTRIATEATGPIDDWHPNGGDGIEPWPEEGIGYSQHNGGKSIFAIRDVAGANVAFGLDYGREVNKDLFTSDGLILQHRLMGNDVSGEGLSSDEKDSDPGKDADNVRSNEVGQIVEIDDITDWQEFWITIEAGELEIDGQSTGTHEVNVFHAEDASPGLPFTFTITASTGDDFADNEAPYSYLAIGAGSTGAEGAYDIDFFSWTPGVHEPDTGTTAECVPLNDLLGDLDDSGDVAFADFLLLSDNFGESVDAYEDGDINCNGTVDFADFLALSDNFGKTQRGTTAQAVPEPNFPIGAIGLMFFFWKRTRRDLPHSP